MEIILPIDQNNGFFLSYSQTKEETDSHIQKQNYQH